MSKADINQKTKTNITCACTMQENVLSEMIMNDKNINNNIAL